MKKINLNKLFNLRNKVVLITGSEGKIGSKISDLYLGLNSKVYGIDLRSKKKKDNLSSEIYGGSKAALIQLTKYFAILMAKYNIKVNCISPGGIEDKKHSKYFVKNYCLRVPLNRMGNISDLYGALIYFSGEISNYTIGQNLIIDGGLTAW